MNDRLIIRAANCYRNWMRKHALEPVAENEMTILSQLRWMQQRLEQIQKWSRRFLKGMTPRIQVEVGKLSVRHTSTPAIEVYRELAEKMIPNLTHGLVRDLNNTSAMLEAMVGPETCNPLSIRKAVEELTVINASWDEVTYRKGVLSVPIGNVSLTDDSEEVELGKFVLHLCLNDPIAGLLVKATNPVEGNKGYCHPHVRDGILCFGEGEDMIRDALRQGRLEDYFRIVETIIRTYNKDSPYEPLSDWYAPDREEQSLCSMCEEWIDNDYAMYCPRCDEYFCENCNTISECKNCVEWYCSECMASCGGCSDPICYNCATSCCNCEQTFCKTCIRECEKCNNLFCEICSLSCSECESEMCCECGKECDNCGDIHCDSCLVICEECGEYNCNLCIKTCPPCDKKKCTNCVENECDHCGVSMCKPCGAEHNCLLAKVNN